MLVVDKGKTSMPKEWIEVKTYPAPKPKVCEACGANFQPMKGPWERRCQPCREAGRPYKTAEEHLNDLPF